MTKKNNLWKTNTIVIAAFKLLIIPRIFGLFPYWKDYSKNTIGVVYSVCVITLLMASGGYSIFTILTSPFGMSVDIILDTAQITIVHYTLIASILSSIFHRSEYVDAMDCLKDSSCYIRRNGSYITYNCYEPLILIVKLINIILGAFSLLATQRTNTYFIEIYIFFTTVSLVSIKQSEVNGLLSLASAQFDSSLRQLQVLGSTPFYRGKLTKIEYNVIIYTKLAKACEHFDNIYSTQFFMMTLSTILIKTASLFSFLKVYLHHLLYSSRMTFYSYINHFVLIAIFTVESILTVKACSSIKQKVRFLKIDFIDCWFYNIR